MTDKEFSVACWELGIEPRWEVLSGIRYEYRLVPTPEDAWDVEYRCTFKDLLNPWVSDGSRSAYEARSEERRVGKEWRTRGSPEH